jgi:hypothetical protein
LCGQLQRLEAAVGMLHKRSLAAVVFRCTCFARRCWLLCISASATSLHEAAAAAVLLANAMCVTCLLVCVLTSFLWCCCVVLRPQVTAAMRLADGVLLVVDVLEGVGAATERAIQQAVQEGLAITMLVSKVRRSAELSCSQRWHMFMSAHASSRVVRHLQCSTLTSVERWCSV